MNCSTTRFTTPAAAPRTGRGESAPRGTQYHTGVPFAALPHALRKDPQLKGNRTAIVLAAALLEYARSKPSCYPSNARLAEDLGVCQQTIRNALAALVAAGWVKVVLGPDQPNGRRIWLCWRCPQPTSNQPRMTSIFPSTHSTTHSANVDLGSGKDQDPSALTPNLPQLSDPLKPVGPPLQAGGSPPQPVGPPLQPVGPETRIVIVEGEENSDNSRALERRRGPCNHAQTGGTADNSGPSHQVAEDPVSTARTIAPQTAPGKPAAPASISRGTSTPRGPLLTAQEAHKAASVIRAEETRPMVQEALPVPSGGLLGGVTMTADSDPTPRAFRAAPLPLDLGAIGRMTPAPPLLIPPGLHAQSRAISPRPSPPQDPARPRPVPRRKKLGLDLAELAQVVGATADPILAAELARRTAPPTPPEPPPQALPTVELFELLPGRHDLIMVAARRLSEETNDFKPASLRTFERMAEAVATRSVPPAVLIDCWRQGTGPKSEHKGKVLVAAWKRSVAEVPLRC